MLFQIGGFERDKVKSIFIEKCRYKKIEPSYDLFFEKTKLVPHHESGDKFKPLEENMNSGDKIKYKNKFLI